MIVVPWSGGLDSTLVLWRAACESESTREPVMAVTVVSDIAGAQQATAERDARNALTLELGRIGLEIDFETIEIKAGFHYQDDVPRQPAFWIGAIAPLIPDRARVQWAYHVGDTFWLRSQEFVAAFDHLAKLTGTEASCEFPIWTHSKVDILKEMQRIRLANLCWWCEEPIAAGGTWGKCGRCQSCESYLAATWLLNHEKSKPKEED